MVNLNPKSFQDTPLCELCFEDALKAGAKKSEKLKPADFKETSIRFCIDGLYKWYKSFSRHYGKSSVFVMIRDASWWWASFCGTDPTLTKLVREYYALLKDITENTSYADLAERMDEAPKIKEVGRSGYPFSVLIPFECHGIISDCAAALGMTFGQFYQLGLAKALAANRNGMYSKWVADKVDPLLNEVMGRAEDRLRSFREIRGVMLERQLMDAEEDSLHNVGNEKSL